MKIHRFFAASRTSLRLKAAIGGVIALGSFAAVPPAWSQETRAPSPSMLRSLPSPALPVTSLSVVDGSASAAPASPAPVARVADAATVPSLDRSAATSNAEPAAAPLANASQRQATLTLPTDAGQYWVEYDLTPYTRGLKEVERPHQALIDWIVRDTGTDVWFTEPMGILSADRSKLRVYHNEAMHQKVKQVYERFVNGPVDGQRLNLRLVTVANPLWRQRALAWMRSVDVQSPGVQAWLVSKENAALLMAMLQSRGDTQVTQLPQLVLFNGQSAQVEQLQSRNYLREYGRQENPYPAYLPVSDEIQEGYRLQVSPLLSTDLQTLDLWVKCSIDQVEKLNSVPIELPTAAGGVQSATIQVPQVASWRLNERFRWPTDQVLVLSCGVIAAPTAAKEPSLLGNVSASNFFGMDRLVTGIRGVRTDAVLLLEYKGREPASESRVAPATAQAPNPVSRGRY